MLCPDEMGIVIMTGGHACTACPHGGMCMQGSMHSVTCKHILGFGHHLRSDPSRCQSGTAECQGSVGAMRVNLMTLRTDASVQ